VLTRIMIALPLAAAGALWFYFLALPWPIGLGDGRPEHTAFMRMRVAEAEARGDSLRIRRDWVPLDRISSHLRRAVVVAEDGRFYDHAGVDWDALRQEFRYQGDGDFSILDADDRRALIAAYRYYRENRERIRGRSTITQQVAKNLYFGSQRSPARKIEELIVARRLERFMSKDQILELYLNIAEWGPGVFGAEAAARHYFDRPAADLTRAQAAALAATLPHPLSSNPRHQPGRMAWRQQLILQRMGGSGPVQTVPLAPEPETPDTTGPTLLGEPVPDPAPPDTTPPDTTPPDTTPPGRTPPDTMPHHRTPPDTL
jgi:monofunctional glycosyltransferase